jgi:hypothetical protein
MSEQIAQLEAAVAYEAAEQTTAPRLTEKPYDSVYNFNLILSAAEPEVKTNGKR